MRTTLDLDEALLEAAAHATGARTKTALIEMGLRALIEQAARRRLSERRGTIPRARAPRRRRTSA
jgi:Arc/MetJ family transcription regulator